MRVIENFELPRKVIDLLAKRGERRSNAYSVTKLICCPRKTFYKMIGVKELILDNTQLIFARGRGHHGILEVFDLKEVPRRKNTIDGRHIVYADIDTIDEHIIEIFTTTISSNRVKTSEDAIKVFPLKVRQLMAYCNFSGEVVGDLLVFFLFGDYSRFDEVNGKKVYKGMTPLLRAFTYNFEREELEEIWKKMNENCEDIEYARKTGRPPLMVGEEFECKNCGYSYKCLSEEPVEEKPDAVL